ncbi:MULTISPECIES: TolC family protein [Asticcacaulis]|uniref:TolC family protein n=1 Tax=Asticcacaulis TaxID=76890 RepID=UPI001AE3C8D6|nr:MULTISPECIES: TolC family protein [Asticcacaulis]MBP2160466.1 cobalt-zinc-cadmium efflux system outer membrane protein [Asticcacaulis solisilvae]MDR6801511.1 cobalt-zinc-cadmium efflux system outer membrane protein [Asticcacaulis sp. BE141]
MISLNLRGKRALKVATAGIASAYLLLGTAAFAEPLTLSAAMSRAANADPAARATQQRLVAADANIRQAGFRPNPSIGLEAENILGSAPYNGLSQAETTLSYQQPLERKSKREARVGVASAGRDLVVAQGRARAWAIMNDAQDLWIEAAAADAEVTVARERLALAQTSQSEITRRVDAARDPLFAGSLANADVASAQIALDQAIANAAQVKLQLATLWGGAPDFDILPAWFEDLSAIKIDNALVDTPDLEVLRAEQRVASAQIRVETTRRTQDPTLSAGVRHYQGDGAFAFVVGGSIPIGRFDNNQGNIDRSRADAEAAATDIEVAERIRIREISASTIKLSNYAREVRRIDEEVIPIAERAVTQVREGFGRGGFTYRDVIGAQETLVAAKARRVEVLKQFHTELAKRDRLSGRWVALLPEQAPNS